MAAGDKSTIKVPLTASKTEQIPTLQSTHQKWRQMTYRTVSTLCKLHHNKMAEIQVGACNSLHGVQSRAKREGGGGGVMGYGNATSHIEKCMVSTP